MHYPVMLRNVIKTISNQHIQRKMEVVDCNFGLGGHSNAILKTFPNAYVYLFILKIVLVTTSITKSSKNTPNLPTFTPVIKQD